MGNSLTLKLMNKRTSDKQYINTGNQAVLKLIPQNSQLVLDVGCGNGANAKILKGRGITVDGITISKSELNTAKEFLRKASLHNLENGLPDAVKKETYDAVICSHVLEHICYPDQLLKDIWEVLSPGGILVVALPNLMHYKSRLELLKGNFNYQESGLWDYTHFRWYTFKTGRELLEKNNFQLLTADVSGRPPMASILSKILNARMEQSVFTFLKKISPGLFGYQLIYSGRKKEV
jgi:SAM-dependent methyltransferase